MFKTKTVVMVHPKQHSSQHNNFLGAIGLLVVAALWCALMGRLFGFIVMGALIGILFTRAGWARIVTLVIVGYVGMVGLLVSLFARGDASFAGFVAALMALAIFWLLLRPGMSQYFSAEKGVNGRVDLWSAPSTDPRSARPQTSVTTPSSQVGAGSTQEQWARLQQQLRAEQMKEEREAASAEPASHDNGAAYPWLATIFAVLIFAYASSVGSELGRAAMLLVIPGFIAAMVRWIPARGFLLGVLALSGFLIVRPEWKIVSAGIGTLLQHHGPMVFGAVALLVYVMGMCISGFSNDCENA